MEKNGDKKIETNYWNFWRKMLRLYLSHWFPNKQKSVMSLDHDYWNLVIITNLLHKNRREHDADWQWLLNSNNHCQATLHSFLFIEESVEMNKT